MSRRSWFGRKSAKNSIVKKNFRPTRLQMEQLETRRLQAADGVEAFILSGTLYVYGTQQSDNIAIRVSPSKIEIPGVLIKNERGELVASVARHEVPYQVIATGQAGDDRIELVEEGSSLPVVFYGNQGRDTLTGGSRNDALVGMDDLDTLIGGGGDDRLIAGLYDDGSDPVQGAGFEVLDGGAGDDALYGTAGQDFLFGGAGNDKLMAFGGDDVLVGDAGFDHYDGGAGVDVLYETSISGSFSLRDGSYSQGGMGVDEFGQFSAWGATMPLVGIERANLAANSADAAGVTIDASEFSGDVSIHGTSGNDVLKGGRGNDAIFGGAGADQLTGGLGTNVLDGGPGWDAVFEQIGPGGVQLNDAAYTALATSTVLQGMEQAILQETIARTPASMLHAAFNDGMVEVRDPAGQNVTANYLAGGLLDLVGISPNSNLLNTDQRILRKHKEFGGDKGTLGEAIGKPVNFANGQMVEYKNGAIYLVNDAVFALRGRVWLKYKEMGAHHGVLGFPKTDVVVGGKGLRSYNQATFQHGMIVTRTIGAFALHGQNFTKFVAGGGIPTYGLPTADQKTITIDGKAATVSDFANGAIYSTAAGTFSLHGAVYNKYRDLGMHNGVLGLPTSELKKLSMGILTPYVQMTFERGTILSDITGQRLHEVHGEIYRKFVAGGGVARFGLPNADETPVTISGVQGARSNFNWADIYWSPATGAHVVPFEFRAAYNSPSQQHTLGFPINDGENLGDGRAVTFQRGALLYSARTGVHAVSGWFYTQFMRYGGVSIFGFPTHNESLVSVGPHDFGYQQQFERGNMVWLYTHDGQFVVSYPNGDRNHMFVHHNVPFTIPNYGDFRDDLPWGLGKYIPGPSPTHGTKWPW